MKDLGYYGTLEEATLVSSKYVLQCVSFDQQILICFPSVVGVVQTAIQISQITGLLSWLCDLVRVLMAEPEGKESPEKLIGFGI